jgi:hypothetical protein
MLGSSAPKAPRSKRPMLLRSMSLGSRSRIAVACFAIAGLLAACAPGDDRASTGSQRSRDGRERVLGAAESRFRPLRFAVIGDFGSGLPAQNRVADRMCRWRRNHSFRMVFTTGDNVYENGEPERFDEAFFKPYSCLLNDGALFHASLGNHDVRTANGDFQVAEPAFGYKDGKRNYVIQKRGVRFVVVDATDLRESWLRENTKAGRRVRFTIVIFHFPIYSSGHYETYSDWRQWMPALLAKRGVDLVLNGHDHLYSVTKPLKKIRYVVTGGGGASLYACGEHWYAAVCRSHHHFLYVVAERDRLWVRAIPPRGDALHGFSTRGLAP